MIFDHIIQAITVNRIIISRHAKEEAEADHLTLADILFSVVQGELIENYPDDRPYPSCLIYGSNRDHEPIHSVWAYNDNSNYAIIVTVYRPDPEKWVNWRVRIKML